MRSPFMLDLLGGLLSLGFFLAFGQAAPPSTQGGDAGVEIKVVKFAGLEEAVKQRKGKVVVVDFWADFCVPCKKAFPHLVALHNKHAKEGLAVLSVNLDDPTDAKARDRSIKFLKDQKASFTNLFIDAADKPEDWFSRLQIESIPALFIFNRESKLEKRYADELINHEEVGKLVSQMLTRK